MLPNLSHVAERAVKPNASNGPVLTVKLVVSTLKKAFIDGALTTSCGKLFHVMMSHCEK